MNLEDIRAYCLSKPFVTEDMPFGDDYITFRVGGKIFCCMPLARGNIIQLKWDPEEFDEITEKYTFINQAWHWHKRHMIQIENDISMVDVNLVRNLIDRSYSYVFNRLPKKIRATLTFDADS